MKIAILSRTPKGYSVTRLKEEAALRDHQAKALDPLRFAMGLEEESPDLFYRNKPLSHYDAVIPRIGASITFFGLAVLRQFEIMGVYSANESIAIARARDKLRSMQILSRYDIGIPATTFARHRDDIIPAIERVGGDHERILDQLRDRFTRVALRADAHHLDGRYDLALV